MKEKVDWKKRDGQWTLIDERRYLKAIGTHGEITQSLILLEGCRHRYALELLKKYRVATLKHRRKWDLPYTKEEAIAEIDAAASWHRQQKEPIRKA